MSIQNLISAVLPADVKTAILQKLSEIKASLGFLITLQPSDKREFVRVGNSYSPFLEKAHTAVTTHPEIMPGVFNIEEFKRDVQLAKDLTPILNQVNELANALQDTIFAVNSDAMAAALEIYAAVQQNKDKVPGLNILAEEMQEFFKKARKAKEKPAQ